MSNRTCTESNCDRSHYARDLCKPHYKSQARRTATLAGSNATLRGIPAADVIRLKSSPSESGCWVWNAAKDAKGYGRVQYDSVQYLAHRLSYSTALGPIADGMTLDHLCRNTSCVNPLHLEQVTLAENVRRANASK